MTMGEISGKRIDAPCERVMRNHVGRIVYPLLELAASRNIRSTFEELCRCQFLPYSSLKKRQDEKLRRLIRHAYRHVVFYRRRLDDRGIDPEAITGIDRLPSIPILKKSEIRSHVDGSARAGNFSRHRFQADSTSGSAGEPLRFYRDRLSQDHTLASFLLFNQWANIHPGDRTVHIGAPEPFSLKQSVSNLIQRHTRIPVFDLSRGSIEKTLDRIYALRPAMIEGYASAIYQIARVFRETGNPWSPQAVVCTSDTMPDWELVRKTFDCPVFNRYGNRELCGALAQNCAGGNALHINTERCVLEIVDGFGQPVADGKRGRVLVTDLVNYAMPFIRYDTGDMATAGGTCECGRGFPLFSRIEGRESEFLMASGGNRISSIAFSHYLFVYHRYVDDFSHFQAEQLTPNEIVFRFVPARPIRASFKRILLADLQKLVGRGIGIRIDFVDKIAPESSGKQVIIKSRIFKEASD